MSEKKTKKITAIFKMKYISKVVPIALIISMMLYSVPVDESWSNWTLPLSGYIFVVDAGHGGADGGAVSKNGIVEKDITLSISEYLRDYLNESGAYVIMTREGDYDLADEGTKGLSNRKIEDLKKRIEISNNSKADFFISIHLNSTTSSTWRGAQTFYYPVREDNEIMAECIQKELIINLKNSDRVPLPRNNILVLKNTEIPATMVEVGFLSNPEEAELLNDKTYQKKIAFAIYQGILMYYSEKIL